MVGGIAHRNLTATLIITCLYHRQRYGVAIFAEKDSPLTMTLPYPFQSVSSAVVKELPTMNNAESMFSVEREQTLNSLVVDAGFWTACHFRATILEGMSLKEGTVT